MLLTMCVGLYTSRVVLNVLGVSDYGVYNVVGGIVNMLAFFNVGMMGATQRFISYELGKGDNQRLNTTFCTSVITHIIIAIIIIVIAEVIGVWLLNTRLNIPEGRMFAANCVLQLSIITFSFSVLIIPFNSCIIAHEHMNIYAYVSIIEALLKLGIAICLMFATIDHLILYASLILSVQLIVNIIYYIYCKRNFNECDFYFVWDKPLLKQMFSFAGWGMLGNTGFTFKDQGSNIILNLFFGTTINAARGVATQVNGIINSFAANFSMAMNPQITKLYAAGKIEESMKLVYAGSRFTFFLLSLIVVPFLINSNYILHLWLGIVPDYTNVFVYIILIGSLIYSLAHTVATAIHATGNVKWLQISLSTILLLELPIAYIVLKFGGQPHYALLPSLFTIPLSVLARFIILKHYVPKYSYREYLSGSVLRCIAIFILCFLSSYYIHSLMPSDTIYTLIYSSLISFSITSGIILFGGLKASERALVINKLKTKMRKYSHVYGKN